MSPEIPDQAMMELNSNLIEDDKQRQQPEEDQKIAAAA